MKDTISLKLKSKSARKIAIDRIVDILEENQTLNSYYASDIRILTEIRDLWGHNLKKSEIERKANALIDRTFTAEHLAKQHDKNHVKKTWDKLKLDDKLSKVAIYIINELQNVYKNEYIDSAQSKKKRPTKSALG